MGRNRNPDAGVSLVEIIISIFILALISGALVPLFITGTQQVARTEQISTASQMVSSRLDAARALANDCGSIGALDGREKATAGSYPLTRRTTVEACPGTGGTVAVRVAVGSSSGVVLASAETRIYVAALDPCSFPHATAASAVELGTAFGYSLFASAALTNAGASVYPGHVGAGGPITGMTTAETACSVQSGTSEENLALSDVVTAYDSAASRIPTGTVAGDLAGVTLHAGVFRGAAALAMTTTLVFDAQGDPDAIFIIQVPAALNTAAASNMVLANGALASNIYWQVLGAVTLGASSHFVGTILGHAAITLGAGTSVYGRALTMGGAVTASNNVFSTPGQG